MNRTSQSLLIALIGGALLWISLFTDTYKNYVKSSFQPYLIAAGVCLIVLGAIGVVRDWHAADDDHDHDGHSHSRGPLVAWLMCLPVLAIFVVAPPALGSFSATRGNGTVTLEPSSKIATVPGGGPAEMKIWEFASRAYNPKFGVIKGQQVKLTGFVVPRKNGWLVARMMMNCCAADSIASTVLVRNQPQPPEKSWVQVEGTWVPPKSGTKLKPPEPPEFKVTKLTRISPPADQYESR